MGLALSRTAVYAAIILLAACGSSAGGGASTPSTQATSVPQLTVASADFESGAIPRDLTCDGGNRAPSFSVTALPAGARSLALEMLDPDGPGGNFTHWLAYSDGAAASTVAGFPPATAVQGKNDKGTTGYTGPCPPPGPPHHYHVMVFALGFALGPQGSGLPAGFSRAQLDNAITSNTGPLLARGDLVATYTRA
jgi:Raf kinase inhibitor-like YbhB/YbcL family protein